MSDDKTAIHQISDLLADTKKSSAYLIVVSGKTSIGKMYKLDRKEMVLGRGTEADITLEDDGVSRRHAKVVVRSDGSVQLVDLQSTNGTFYNGERVDAQLLRDGDKIQIGSTMILKFSYQDTIDEALQKNLYDSATRDGLTRLYNKKYFLDTIRKEFAYCLRHQVPLSLLIFDIDHFKKINDTYGHPAGDFVLSKLAARVTDTIRVEDILARYGGEEFVLLLRESPEDKSFILAERIRRIIENTDFTFSTDRIKVTVSMGVATLKEGEYTDCDSFIKAADDYLYRAKRGGRNRVEARMLTGIGE
jgi:diguanylate cyclase (GGDEF)-like protein